MNAPWTALLGAWCRAQELSYTGAPDGDPGSGVSQCLWSQKECVESGTDKEDPKKFLERTETVDKDEPFRAKVLLSE